MCRSRYDYRDYQNYDDDYAPYVGYCSSGPGPEVFILLALGGMALLIAIILASGAEKSNSVPNSPQYAAIGVSDRKIVKKYKLKSRFPATRRAPL